MKRTLRFLLPSTLGAFCFLFPVKFNGAFTIPIAILTDKLSVILGDKLPVIGVAIVIISVLLSVYFSWISRPGTDVSKKIRGVFVVGHAWVVLRILGLLTSISVFWKIGPELIWSDATGHIVLYDLVTAIITIFIFASFLLPLLTDFGLMELVGTAFSKTFKKLFRLPGRSCIDAFASWMTAAPVGVVITSRQYESGNYSGREAATIATNFSIVSLPFCVVVANFAGLSHLFVQYYLTVCAAGFITAMILPRIPPLSRIPDDYAEVGRQLFEDKIDQNQSLLSAGYASALLKADKAPSFKQYLHAALHNLFEIWFGLLPPLMFIGTLGMVLAEHTVFFEVLSYPFVPILELMQLPEASAAAPALLVGFAEMFLPAVLSKGIESELTSFVVISVSITQLIYMTEVGVLIMKTRIPLGFLDLVVIFLLRTIIALPIIVCIAHLFVF